MAEATEAARIVLLNGVGSVGKGSVARALQSIATAPFLHVEMDAFLDMLPAAMFDHPDGLVFETVYRDGHPEVVIHTGPVCDRALSGMRHAVAAMAARGNNLIVDEVLTDQAARADYAALLAPFRVHRVGLFAPLEVLKAREHQRGDRAIGLARWQFDRVHAGLSYDLALDTAALSAAECALAIKRRFEL